MQIRLHLEGTPSGPYGLPKQTVTVTDQGTVLPFYSIGTLTITIIPEDIMLIVVRS